eukprot:6391427-Pyramimonas_sp.AAC.1
MPRWPEQQRPSSAMSSSSTIAARKPCPLSPRCSPLTVIGEPPIRRRLIAQAEYRGLKSVVGKTA